MFRCDTTWTLWLGVCEALLSSSQTSLLSANDYECGDGAESHLFIFGAFISKRMEHDAVADEGRLSELSKWDVELVCSSQIYSTMSLRIRRAWFSIISNPLEVTSGADAINMYQVPNGYASSLLISSYVQQESRLANVRLRPYSDALFNEPSALFRVKHQRYKHEKIAAGTVFGNLACCSTTRGASYD
ncbi:hypothetical protein OBBRIDRAFT_807827 [Obba rivulosa]|uniref:Uncharacterized protein n=1 Tax=Obba rivulosa TaxID=1052685 RepID=A0A8E2AIX8_9APHY|nr:hypothetical protein OBBRIDRAFT_807827 [Obba rivulosa]